MASQAEDEDTLDSLNPWAVASPSPSASTSTSTAPQAGQSRQFNDSSIDHDSSNTQEGVDEMDVWKTAPSNTTRDTNTHSAPDNTTSITQLTNAYDEFDPFRPDSVDSIKQDERSTSNTLDNEASSSQGTQTAPSSKAVYSDTTPPPTPSKRGVSGSDSTRDRAENSHAVKQAAPLYTSTGDTAKIPPSAASSSSSSLPAGKDKDRDVLPGGASSIPSSKAADTTSDKPYASTSASASTSTPLPFTSTSSNTAAPSTSTSSTTSNTTTSALSNPLATIASAFRKRDFSSSSATASNTNNPSRAATPIAGSSSASNPTAGGASGGGGTAAPHTPTSSGKPAPVILIRDNNDDNMVMDESEKEAPPAVPSLSSSSYLPSSSSSSSNSSNEKQRKAVGVSVLNEGREGGEEEENIQFDFNFFLEQMKSRQAEPIAKYLRSFLREFNKKMWNVNDQIRVINDFLDFIAIKMRENEVWKHDSEREFDNAVEGMEKLVMNRVFHLTFVPALEPAQQATTQTDDLERDHVLSQRIKLFQWVSEEHLDLPEHKDTASFVEFAKQELRKINTYKAPRDKLICILNACKVIFGLMRHLSLEDGADTFIPFLILVVLRSNPDHLISNVQYIQRFRNPDRLSGENGYYLSSLNAAISFIETMDGSSLSNITQEQFEKNVEEAIRNLPPDDEQQELPAVPSSTATSKDSRGQASTSTRASSSAGPSSHSMPSSPVKPMNEKRSSYHAEASLQAQHQPPPRSQSPAEATRDFFIRSSDNLQKTVSKPLQALGKIFTEMGSDSDIIAGYPGQGRQQSSSANANASSQYRLHQQPLSPHMGQQQHLPTPRGQRPPSLRTRSTASLGSPVSPQGRSNRLPPLPPGAQGHYAPGYIPNVPQQSTRPPGMTPQDRGSSYQAADFLDDSVPAEEVQATADKNYQATFNAKIDTLANIFPGIERETLEIVLLSNGEDVERTIEGLLDMQ